MRESRCSLSAREQSCCAVAGAALSGCDRGAQRRRLEAALSGAKGGVQGSGVEAVACCLGQGGVTLTACRAVGDRCSAVLGTGRQ